MTLYEIMEEKIGPKSWYGVFQFINNEIKKLISRELEQPSREHIEQMRQRGYCILEKNTCTKTLILRAIIMRLIDIPERSEDVQVLHRYLGYLNGENNVDVHVFMRIRELLDYYLHKLIKIGFDYPELIICSLLYEINIYIYDMDTKKYHNFIPKVVSKSEEDSLHLIKSGNFSIPEKLTDFSKLYANDKKYTMSKFRKIRSKSKRKRKSLQVRSRFQKISQ